MVNASSQPYVEHINATVQDVDLAVRFLTTALSDWQVRGSGTMDWCGMPMHWVHVGSNAHYVALQSGGSPGLDWRGNDAGIKHVGIVVPSVRAVVERLAAAGFEPDHWGGETPHRQNVYFMLGNDFLLEFVEYKTPDLALRNCYA